MEQLELASEICVAAVSLTLSTYILTLSFGVIGDEIFKWYTVNVFAACIIEDIAEVTTKTFIITSSSAERTFVFNAY